MCTSISLACMRLARKMAVSLWRPALAKLSSFQVLSECLACRWRSRSSNLFKNSPTSTLLRNFQAGISQYLHHGSFSSHSLSAPLLPKLMPARFLTSDALREVQRADSDVAPVSHELNESQRREVVTTVRREADIDQNRENVFAVVQLCGSQYKVTLGDLVIVWQIEAPAGASIRLEKVLLVGGRNFSLIGRPLLSRNLVQVEATVVEHMKGRKIILFRHRKRKNYKKWRGHRRPLTALRIERISIDSNYVENESTPL